MKKVFSLVFAFILLISSGCYIPPLSKWENIDAFFAAVAEYYSDKGAV